MRGALTAILIAVASAIPAQQRSDDIAPRSGQVINQDGSIQPPEREIPFTWWNDLPEMIRRGNEHLHQGNTEYAEEFYRDARLRRPDEAVAAFNLGLARAHQNDHLGAARAFTDARNLSAGNPDLESQASYNLGLSNLHRAIEAVVEEDRDHAIDRLIDSIDAFDAALGQRAGDFEDAEFNKRQAQRFLQALTLPPPMAEMEQQSGDGDGEDSPAEGQQQQGQQPPPEEGDSEETQSGDDQEGQQPAEGEDMADQPADPGQQDTEARAGEPADPDRLTEEQARQMLNLLDDTEHVTLRQRAGYDRPPLEKDW